MIDPHIDQVDLVFNEPGLFGELVDCFQLLDGEILLQQVHLVSDLSNWETLLFWLLCNIVKNGIIVNFQLIVILLIKLIMDYFLLVVFEFQSFFCEQCLELQLQVLGCLHQLSLQQICLFVHDVDLQLRLAQFELVHAVEQWEHLSWKNLYWWCHVDIN